jgi:hypothetical protein
LERWEEFGEDVYVCAVREILGKSYGMDKIKIDV